MITNNSVFVGINSSNDDIGRIHELIRLASVHNMQFQNELSRRYADEALQLASRIDYKQGIAEAGLYLGLYFMGNENFEEAQKHFSRALDLAEKVKDQGLKLRCLGNIGNLHYRAKNYPEAKKYYERSLKLSILLKDRKTIAIGWQSLGNVNYALDDLLKAERNFQQVRELATEIQDRNILSYAILGLGAIAADNKDFAKSFEYFREALRFGQEMGNLAMVVSTYKAMAEACSRTGKTDEAVLHLETALALAEKSNLKYSISELYLALSSLHEKNDNYATAFEYYDKYVLLRDVIYNEESKVKITEMQSLYELELKKKEAEIYRIKTEELQRAKDETELAFQKLREAQRDLISMEKRNLSLVMAVTANHEINQPLMIIKGNLELLELTLVNIMNDTKRKHIVRINESIDRMEEILLRYDSIEKGRQLNEE